MYCEKKDFNIYFREEMFFQIFVAKGDKSLFFFLKKKKLMSSTVFINKPWSFLEVMVLIFSFKCIFQRKENRIINLVLKAPQQKGTQLP